MAGTRNGSTVAVVAATALFALAGCGSDAPAPATTTKPVESAEPAVDREVAEATQRTTGALTIGRATAPVDLRFALGSAPRAGEPVPVELALVTRVPVPTVDVELSGGPDVQILEPPSPVQLEKVQAGTLQTVRLKALAAKAGTATVTVTVSLRQPTGPESRTFQFPIVVAPAG